MLKSKKLKGVLLVGISLVVLIFISLPILGHAWRKKNDVWHPVIAPASSWKRFTSAEGGFSVLFPGIPENTNILSDVSSPNVEQHAFYVNANIQNGFTVTYCDSPIFEKMAKLSSPQVFLEKAQSLMVSREKGKVVFQQETKFQDYPAREFEYVAGGKANYSTRAKFILVGHRVYQIYVVFLTANPYPEERAIFFNSFKIHKE